MEQIKIKGKVIAKEEAKNITENFQKGNCVIETDEQYPQFITVDFVNKNTDKLNYINIGDIIEVSAYLQGKKYERDGNTRYFLSLNGTYVTTISKGNNSQNAQPASKVQANAKSSAGIDDDNLPF